MYATTEKGEGRVSKIGEYEGIDDIEVICGMFADDVIITFVEQNEKD